jgi:hypothetical protein
MSVTTTANFTIPAIGSSTGSVAVTDTSQTPQNSVITVYNASAGKVALMQVGVVTDGTHFASLETLDIFAGAAGDTMPSGSVITFPSAPLSSLPSLSSPSGSDLLYVVHSGTSYQSTVTEVVTAGGGGGGGGISYPTLASAFTPATPGNTATATLSAAPTGALFPGMKIQLPITGSDEPFEGIVESISGTSVVIRTPIPTSTNPVGGFQVAPPVECPALSSFTWYNQGTAVSANGFGFNRVMNITYAGSVEYRLLGLPQANTPFTLTALIYANFPDINSSLAGIYVMDTVSICFRTPTNFKFGPSTQRPRREARTSLEPRFSFKSAYPSGFACNTTARTSSIRLALTVAIGACSTRRRRFTRRRPPRLRSVGAASISATRLIRTTFTSVLGK